MQGTQKPTVQDIEKTNQGGDAPAPEVQDRGAPGAQAVRAPQDYEDYGVDLKRGDIYVWNGREGRKYRLRKESSATVEVRCKTGVMLKYYGRNTIFTIRAAKVAWIDMTRDGIDVYVFNDEQVDDDRIILRSFDKGKIDEFTQGTVDAVMARFNIHVRMNLPYIEEECSGCNACVEIVETKNAKELGIRILSKRVKTRWI